MLLNDAARSGCRGFAYPQARYSSPCLTICGIWMRRVNPTRFGKTGPDPPGKFLRPLTPVHGEAQLPHAVPTTTPL
jgi:hypothetical protein